MSARGIYTNELKCAFVKKEAADCGDGKEFNMEVTLDQLAEIMYRVKDAWFTSGSITGYHVYTPWEISDGMASPHPPKPEERTGGISWVDEDVSNPGGPFGMGAYLGMGGNWRRGYYINQDVLGVPNGLKPIYFGDEYLGFMTYTYYDEAPTFSSTGYRDILPDELGLWQRHIDSGLQWCSCAFNHHTDMDIEQYYP